MKAAWQRSRRMRPGVSSASGSGAGTRAGERLPGRRDGGGAVGGVFVERVPDDLGDGLALLVGFTVLAHRFKHVGEFVMGEHEFAGISGGFQFAQAVVKEGDDFFGGLRPALGGAGHGPAAPCPGAGGWAGGGRFRSWLPPRNAGWAGSRCSKT